MALKFGKDGTLYCDTVKYNYKQARNIVADGTYGNISGAWSLSNITIDSSLHGYKSWRSFLLSSNVTSIMTQPAPTPIAGHKYYGSIMWKTTSTTFSVADARFEWYVADTSDGTLVFAQKTTPTNNNWVRLSNIVSLSSVRQGSWVIRNFAVNGSTNSYCSRLMIIDLTDTFGAGNEPTKEWCDNNIRENETYANFGCVSQAITTSNYDTAFSVGNATATFTNFLQSDSNSLPREYLVNVTTSTSYVEGVIQHNSTGYLDNGLMYYGYWEVQVPPLQYSGSMTSDIYFPVDEPLLGQVKVVTPQYYNGGGGMTDWKRISTYNNRSSFTNGNYLQRWDFNNQNVQKTYTTTALSVNSVNDNVSQYNNYNSTSISISNVNKEWCDRWIDARSCPIIHIKDPGNKTIKFLAPKDIEELPRTRVNNETAATYDNWSGMVGDTWSAVINANNSMIGKDYYVNLALNGQLARMRITVTGIDSNSVVVANNHEWSVVNNSMPTDRDVYDIECNDIEIRPEVNSIKMNKTGTIICKKLIRTKGY